MITEYEFIGSLHLATRFTNDKEKYITMRMSLQYSLVNQVLYAMDATITAKSL